MQVPWEMFGAGCGAKYGEYHQAIKNIRRRKNISVSDPEPHPGSPDLFIRTRNRGIQRLTLIFFRNIEFAAAPSHPNVRARFGHEAGLQPSD